MIKKFIYKMKASSYWIFAFQLFKFILIVAILDFVIGGILNFYYFRQRSGFQFRTTYALDSTRADILIFGSSRANHHYHPEIFEARLKQSYYNAGRDGNFIFYHDAVLKAVLERHTPKIVILDFVNEEFKKGQYSYDRLSSLLPYYASHPEIRSIVELRSPYEKFKLLSQIYPYNSSLFTIAVGNTSFNKSRKIEKAGYVPLFTVLDEKIAIQPTAAEAYEVDSTKIQYYKSFIESCIKANVRVYIVCSPYYIKPVQNDYSIIKAKEIALRYKVDFLDYSNDSTFFRHASFFSDEIHLNDRGAREFTNKVVDEILINGK